MKNKMMAGFTLFEVLMASIVFAMMAGSLLSYVQYGSAAWKKGQQRMTVSSSFRMVSNTIQRDLQQADKVIAPALKQTSTRLKYDIPVLATGTYLGTATLALEWLPVDRILQRRVLTTSTNVSNVLGPVSAEVTGPSTTNSALAGYKFVIARDVATFSVTRVSTWSVDVAVGIESSMSGDEERVENKLATMTFVIPCGR